MNGIIRIGILLGVVALVGIFAISRWPIKEPVALGMMQGDARRGAYLARSSGCIACHTDAETGGAALAGGAPLKTPFGTFVPPNITSDPAGGIGSWTLDDFAVAVRQGVRPDGKAYYPAFPYEFYNTFSDQDIADLWTAFRTVPAVAQVANAHSLRFPFSQRWALKLWRARYMTQAELAPVMAQSDAWNRGQELVNGASHCAACHTDRGLFGGLKTSDPLAGNDTLPGGSKAPSIQTASLVAQGWSVSNMSYALRTGIMPDGDVFGGSMAEAVAAGTSYMTDADRDAIATYLLTPPGQTAVQAPAPVASGSGPMAGMVMEGN